MSRRKQAASEQALEWSEWLDEVLCSTERAFDGFKWGPWPECLEPAYDRLEQALGDEGATDFFLFRWEGKKATPHLCPALVDAIRGGYAHDLLGEPPPLRPRLPLEMLISEAECAEMVAFLRRSRYGAVLELLPPKGGIQ
jgi:hypothetical protein